jgi:hypothetical protein
MRLTPMLTVHATAKAHGPQRLSLFRHLTILLHSRPSCFTVSEEDEGACKLPRHRRVISQAMRHWAQHQAIADNAPSARQHHLEALHRSQGFDAISRTKAGEPGHSILQSDVTG